MELGQFDHSLRDWQRRVRWLDLLSLVLESGRWKLPVRHRRDFRSQHFDLGLAERRTRYQSD